MFNGGSNYVKINACSGGIYKTFKKSWFEKLRTNSFRAENLFDKDSKIIILQMVIFGEGVVLAELIDKEDFEKELTSN